jgi:proteic killer suppression protein
MIQSFRHKGLAKFFAMGARIGIQAAHTERLRLILAALSAAVAPADMKLPGLKLHPLKGRRAGTWSVSVSGNWRVTFRFSGKNAVDVDYEDYH